MSGRVPLPVTVMSSVSLLPDPVPFAKPIFPLWFLHRCRGQVGAVPSSSGGVPGSLEQKNGCAASDSQATSEQCHTHGLPEPPSPPSGCLPRTQAKPREMTV